MDNEHIPVPSASKARFQPQSHTFVATVQSQCQPVDEFLHQRLLSMFFVYLIVGGMPDAVKTYIATKDIREVDKVQRDITTLYKEDFSQYESEDKRLKLISIYDIIPTELNKQNKKFVFTMLDKELKFDR